MNETDKEFWLKSYFSESYLISMESREDRREAFYLSAESTLGKGRASSIQFYDAINGKEFPPPKWWTGEGAWGCFLSHYNLLLDAYRLGLASYIVFEDDCIFHPHATHIIAETMESVPPDWDMIYFGGQHRDEIREVSPGLLKCRGIHRTHAYAVSNRAFARVAQNMMEFTDYQRHKGFHIDHQLERFHSRLNVYAPEMWACGQSGASSDIATNGRAFGESWWIAETENNILIRPIALVPLEERRELETYPDHYFFGKTLIGKSAVNRTAASAFATGERAFREFLRDLSKSTLARGTTPAIVETAAGMRDAIEKLWPGRIKL